MQTYTAKNDDQYKRHVCVDVAKTQNSYFLHSLIDDGLKMSDGLFNILFAYLFFKF